LGPWGEANEVEDLDDVLAWLQDIGLLASLTGSLLDDRAVLRRHRLVQTAFGAGNSTEQQHVYRVIGHDGSEVARMGQVSYGMWSYSDGLRSVSEVFEQLARETSKPVSDLYRALVPPLVELVKSGALLLDAVR
jgi:hypothetical protein